MDAFYKSDEFREILAQYEQIRDRGEGFLDAADYADVGEYYLAQGCVDDAYRAVSHGVELYPDALPPLAVLARIEQSRGNGERAHQLLEQAEDHEALEYHYTLAELMLYENRADEADRYLGGIEPEEGDEDETFLDIVSMLIHHQQFALAEKWLSRVKDTSKADYKDYRAQILTNRGQYKESERIVNELLDENPYSTEYWNHLAAVQYENGEYEESINSSDFTLAIDSSDGEALLNKANAYFSLARYAEALPFYKRYCEKYPGSASAEYYYGVTLVNLERDDEALERLQKALAAAEPEAAGDALTADLLHSTLHELAILMTIKGENEQAIDYADKALRRVPADNDDYAVERAQVLLTKGKAYLQMGDADRANECMQEALAASDQASVFITMTNVLYETGHAEEAFYALAKKVYLELENTWPDDSGWDDAYAYMARYAMEAKLKSEFFIALTVATEKCPETTRLVFADVFPQGADPRDFPFLPPKPGE